jgi:predicted branched-subunit amino acid permease
MTQWNCHRRDLGRGARDMVPWLLGVSPFGLVIGISAVKADIPTLAGWLTGPLIYGGSAQVAAIGMLDSGAATYAVIITALVINLRLILYSGAMAPHWRGTPWWWKLLGGYLLVDPSFAVGIERYGRSGAGPEAPTQRAMLQAHAHYLGAAVSLWATWLAAIAVGALAGAQLPAAARLEFIIPLFLIGQVVPKLATSTTRRAALTAAAAALLAFSAPLHLGTAIAIVAGIGAGLVPRARRKTSTTTRIGTTTEVRR